MRALKEDPFYTFLPTSGDLLAFVRWPIVPPSQCSWLADESPSSLPSSSHGTLAVCVFVSVFKFSLFTRTRGASLVVQW